MEDVFVILPTGFGKSFIFQLLPRVMSSMNKKAVAVSMIMVIGIDEEDEDAVKNRKVCKYGSCTSVHLPFCFRYLDLSLRRV